MVKLLVDQRVSWRVARHALLFAAMVLLFTWVAHSGTGGSNGFMKDLLSVFVHAFLFFGYAYLTVYILIPYLLFRKKALLFTALFLLSGLALSLLKFLFSDFLFYQAISPEDATVIPSLSLPGLLVNTKDMSFIVAIFAIVKYARDHYVLESNIRELQRKGLEAEIKLVEHHMDPHVIFNNFNSLYSISLNRPDYLGSTVKRLKSVLYYLFLESKQNQVSLAREIEMIENYIGLEKLRYGDRLSITFRKMGEFRDLEIAPLILYPFVENCFVHGAGADPAQSWIDIEISTDGPNIRFLAANSVSDQPYGGRYHEKNSANANCIRRLEIQYPNRHRLSILQRRMEYVVELNIRLRV